MVRFESQRCGGGLWGRDERQRPRTSLGIGSWWNESVEFEESAGSDGKGLVVGKGGVGEGLGVVVDGG